MMAVRQWLGITSLCNTPNLLNKSLSCSGAVLGQSEEIIISVNQSEVSVLIPGGKVLGKYNSFASLVWFPVESVQSDSLLLQESSKLANQKLVIFVSTNQKRVFLPCLTYNLSLAQRQLDSS